MKQMGFISPQIYGMKKTSTKRNSTSVTNEEIAKFWRRKRMLEEDQNLAAVKASARIRAKNLSEEDYKMFIESLECDAVAKKDKLNQEIRVGIKDWWTKSKYAYLNEPIIDSTNKPKSHSTYIPRSCFYKTLFSTVDSFGMH